MGAMGHQDDDGNVFIRLDEYKYRLLVVEDTQDRLIASGWATRDKKHYESIRARMESLGVEIIESTPEGLKARHVEEYFCVEDPAGNRHEICWGRSVDPSPFISPTGISKFTTGDLGFGHVFIPCAKNFDEALEFYQEVFQFEYSDFFRVPETYAAGLSPGSRVFFFHPPNARQHSLAIAEMENPAGLHHFELEVASLDEVGRAYDITQQKGLTARTLGRHVNDAVVSFYAKTPGGFLMEYGYEGKEMDWESHEVINIPKGSYWGHQWV